MTTQVLSLSLHTLTTTRETLTRNTHSEYKEAFALFDKRGTGAIPREVLGDLLRALGQNPTQAEVADIVAGAPREGAYIVSLLCLPVLTARAVVCRSVGRDAAIVGDGQWITRRSSRS